MRTVGSVVQNVVPEPPSEPVPTPPVHVEVAPAPQVGSDRTGSPHVPRASGRPTSGEAASTASHSVAEVAGSAAGSVEDAAGATVGASGVDRETATPRNPVGGGSDPRGQGRPPGERRSVGLAEEAPLRRGLARVWPAVGLGPIGDLLPAFPGALDDATVLSSPGLARLLSEAAPHGSAPQGDGLEERTALVHRPAPDPRSVSLPVGGELSAFVLFLAAAALIALLVFAIRQELGPMYRWPE